MIFDYNRSTLNVMSSILKNFGGSLPYAPLMELEGLNLGEYDHVILMVFDGMGQSFVENHSASLNLPGSVKNIPLKTVFPPTTAAAMSSLYTGNSPLEHGFLGWSLWFEEYDNRFINILPGTDSSTNKSYFGTPRDIYEIMPLDSFSGKLRRADPELPLYFVSPRAFKDSRYNQAACGPAKSVHYRRFKDMIRAAASSVKKNKNGKSFTMVYNMDPDKFLHPQGIHTGQLPEFMTLLGGQLRKLIKRIEGTNTLLLVTADHGMTEMTDYFKINEEEELFNMLKRPPFPESRVLSLHVKEGQEKAFQTRFLENLGQDFLLLTGKEFLEQGWLGPLLPGVVRNKRLDKLVGTYVAIARGTRGIKYYSERGGKSSPPFKAHHAGMTEVEMEVPLLIYSGREDYRGGKL
jgi:hypothetical protein